jgi:hypothetical protein
MSGPIDPLPAALVAADRFTLVFRNGERLLHQDPIALAQFRCDGRLAAVWREPAGLVLPAASAPGHQDQMA